MSLNSRSVKLFAKMLSINVENLSKDRVGRVKKVFIHFGRAVSLVKSYMRRNYYKHNAKSVDVSYIACETI